MIGILHHSTDILGYAAQVGISSSKIVLNPANSAGLSCLVQVGGSFLYANHCYVQQEGNLPVVQCFPPESTREQPMNRVWILCALAKARAIDNGTSPVINVEIKTSPTYEEAKDFLLACMEDQQAMLSIDLECNEETQEITTIGIMRDGCSTAMSVPLQVEQTSFWNKADEIDMWKLFAGVLAGPNPKLFQNFIFDTMILSYWGLETKGPIYDTMWVAHWINPELPKKLADLARLHLYIAPWKNIEGYDSNERLWEYNARDAAYTLAIFKEQRKLLEKENRYEFIEKQLSPLSLEVLRTCERGWLLDPLAIAKMRASLNHSIEALQAGAKSIASDLIRPRIVYLARRGKKRPGASYFRKEGDVYVPFEPDHTLKKLSLLPFCVYEGIHKTREFNPASPKHVYEVLVALGVKIPRQKGKESTGEDNLLKIIENPQIPLEGRRFIDIILDFRGKSKMINTYCDVAQDFDGITRFSINIAGTVEARFSSKSTPWDTGFNSQNVPKDFRHISLPHFKGWEIVNMDFKAADPHMVAWLSSEDKMLSILSSGGDLHAYTASAIVGHNITKDPGYNKDESKERKLGKACNNGLNYGMQPAKFVETCRKQGISLTFGEAYAAHEAYFKAYPGIRAWHEETKGAINRTRTLHTPFGRRRYFYGHLNDKLYNSALAWVPPSTVADALNAGWLLVSQEAKLLGLRAQALQQCHDSMKFQCPTEELDAFGKLLLSSYKKVTFFIRGRVCNFPVEIEHGPNWGTLKKWMPSEPIREVSGVS